MRLTVEYPESLPDLLQESPRELEREMRWPLAAKMFEMKRISSGVAARLANMERVDFLLHLGPNGVAAIDMDEEEPESDTANAIE